MKEKVVITAILLIMTFITAKTGYAYYENTMRYENKNTEEALLLNKDTNEVQSLNEDTYQDVNKNIDFQSIQLQSEIPEANEIPDSNGVFIVGINETYNNNTSFPGGYNGCGSGYGNMLDANGNFKDRETYEQELDEYVKQGFIDEREKDNFLSIYDQCINVLNGYESDSGSYNDSYDDSEFYENEGYYPPSCH